MRRNWLALLLIAGGRVPRRLRARRRADILFDGQGRIDSVMVQDR
jgi:hypothetical protein